MRNTFRKILFGLIVTSYVITVIGIPVYLHYCGGELEEVNYLTKGSSCCGEEAPEDDGCCQDKGFILKSSVDFTIKNLHAAQLTKSVQTLFYSGVNIFKFSEVHGSAAIVGTGINPPPGLHKQIISITVLRI